MSSGREINDSQTDEDEIKRDKASHLYYTSKHYAIVESSGRGPQIQSDGPSREKIRKYNTNQCFDHNWMFSSGGLGKPEDADYSILPHLNGELETELFPRIPTELEPVILARIGILEYRKLCGINKRISQLVETGYLLKERRINGIREAFVFMLASGEENWWAFDQKFTIQKALPRWPADEVFKSGDKESLCAGTHLLVCGNGFDGPIIWRYEVLMDKWCKGPSMVEPRCLFASASSGDVAYVAGGIGFETNDLLSSVEKYDPETKSWDPLPKMEEERKMCAGAYMDDKFYVVGGQDKNGEFLTCAEVFDKEKNLWIKIRGMLNGLATSQSPPLIAVVNNDLYLFETSSNCLMVYVKDSNTWKNLGPVPVRADLNKGWGVAFKSLGNELLVIGNSTLSRSGRGMTIYTCSPNPNSENQNWEPRGGENHRSHFIMNCTVMVA